MVSIFLPDDEGPDCWHDRGGEEMFRFDPTLLTRIMRPRRYMICAEVSEGTGLDRDVRHNKYGCYNCDADVTFEIHTIPKLRICNTWLRLICTFCPQFGKYREPPKRTVESSIWWQILPGWNYNEDRCYTCPWSGGSFQLCKEPLQAGEVADYVFAMTLDGIPTFGWEIWRNHAINYNLTGVILQKSTGGKQIVVRFETKAREFQHTTYIQVYDGCIVLWKGQAKSVLVNVTNVLGVAIGKTEKSAGVKVTRESETHYIVDVHYARNEPYARHGKFSAPISKEQEEAIDNPIRVGLIGHYDITIAKAIKRKIAARLTRDVADEVIGMLVRRPATSPFDGDMLGEGHRHHGEAESSFNGKLRSPTEAEPPRTYPEPAETSTAKLIARFYTN